MELAGNDGLKVLDHRCLVTRDTALAPVHRRMIWASAGNFDYFDKLPSDPSGRTLSVGCAAVGH